MSAVTAETERLAALIRQAGSVVALTGAGISVPSGIPDFRSPGTGLWEKVNPMEVAHIDVFRRDPERFWHFYGDRFQTLEAKRPNGAHEALAELERAGLLDAVITQNIDQLHARAGSRRLIEVHGTIAHSSCLRCGARYPLADVRARQLADPEGIPRCDCTQPAQARRRAVRRVPAARRAGPGGAARARRRPDAVHRLLARGLSGRRAPVADAVGGRADRDPDPGADAL